MAIPSTSTDDWAITLVNEVKQSVKITNANTISFVKSHQSEFDSTIFMTFLEGYNTPHNGPAFPPSMKAL